MKKLSSLLISIFMLLSFVGCSSTNNITEETENTPEVTQTTIPQVTTTPESTNDTEDSNVLVVYFSATGNTKGIAEEIANITDGTLYEIVPEEPYTQEDLDYGNDQSRTSLEMADPSSRPKIASEPVSIEGYDVIYIGYPIWHGEAPRIMNTFVESVDFLDATIIPFCTSGSSGVGNSATNLQANATGGNWLEGTRLSTNITSEELTSWIEGN